MEKPTANKFRKAREAAGLTQVQAAELLGLHPRTYQRWEESEVARLRNVYLDRLRSLPKAL